MNKLSLGSVGPVLETLEPRLAPAGVVLLTTAGGVLTITGDGLDNGIVITDNPGTGWTITDGLAGTTFKLNGINQALPFNVPAQASVKATLGDGADVLNFVSTDGGMVFTGGITLDMGKGADSVSLGTASTQNLVVQGVTSIDMGADADDLFVKATALFGGAVTLKGNTGNDLLLLDSTANHTFQKSLTVDLGTGADTFEARGSLLTVQGALTIKGAGGLGLNQVVKLNPGLGSLDSAVAITLAAGDSAVTIGKSGGSLRLAAGLSITTGVGTDSVSYFGTLAAGGAVAEDLKDGTNTTTFGAAAVMKANSFSVKGGTGTDTITFGNSNVQINTALTASLGAGSNSMTSGALQKLTTGTLSFTGTTGNDSVEFEGDNLTVLGAATFGLGAGIANSVSINADVEAFFGSHLTITGTTGTDVASFGSLLLRVLGNTTVNLGNGANGLSIDPSMPNSEAAFLGNFTYVGGTGNDSFFVLGDFFHVVRTLQITGGDAVVGNNILIDAETSLIGNFIYSGGKNTDMVALGGAGETTIVMGNTTVNIGAGDGSASVIEAELRGNLNVTTTTIANQTEVLNIKESIIFGATTYNLGAGDSTFEIDDSNLVGDFTANLGAGVDVMKLDATNGSSDPTYWYGLVKINLGIGNDQLAVGTLQANSENNFLKAVTLDGGAGTDTLTKGNNTFVAGEPVPKNFE